MAGTLVYEVADEEGLGVAITLGAAPLYIASSIFDKKADGALSRTIWWHNGTLPRSTGASSAT